MANKPRLNMKRIRTFAEYAKTAQIPAPLNFYSFFAGGGKEIITDDMYPPLRAPGVVEFFFFAMVHNYGFWTNDGAKYGAPVFGTWNGKSGVKGSDLLWKMLCAAWKKDPEIFSPERCAQMSDAQFAAIFSDDNGPIPFFNTKGRIDLTRRYGKWFRTPRWWGVSGPSDLVQYVNDYEGSVNLLREILTHPENGVPGYHEDPLGKKAELLLMALASRPEQLLRKEPLLTTWRPIVDYHDMRLTLRLGHVCLPHAWQKENAERRFTSSEREAAIREATYRADELVIRLSGRTRDEIDILKWSARRYCPEMETPSCKTCALNNVCAQKVELFQPVLLTTHY